MLLVDIATEYASLFIFNKYTKDAVIRIAALFDARSGIKSVTEINVQTISTYKEYMMKLDVAPATFNGYLRYLRIVGRYASEQSYITENWFSRLGPMPEPNQPLSGKAIPKDDLKKIIAWLKNHPNAVSPSWFWIIILKFFYFHGVRRRQLCDIKIGDINFREQSILLRYEGSKTLREWTIPLHIECKKDIERLIHGMDDHGANEQLFNVTQFSHRYSANTNGHMRGEQITGAFKRISRLSGVRIGAQRLRHTTATAICNPETGEAPDLFSAQYLLGHIVLSTTRGYVTQSLHNVRNSTAKLCLGYD